MHQGSVTIYSVHRNQTCTYKTWKYTITFNLSLTSIVHSHIVWETQCGPRVYHYLLHPMIERTSNCYMWQSFNPIAALRHLAYVSHQWVICIHNNIRYTNQICNVTASVELFNYYIQKYCSFTPKLWVRSSNNFRSFMNFEKRMKREGKGRESFLPHQISPFAMFNIANLLFLLIYSF
jgi:hypothetical protein